MFGYTVFISFALGPILCSAQSPSEFVKPGEPTQLTCTAGFSESNIKWTGPNDEEVTGDERHILNNTAGTLNITVVGEDDVGEFYCSSRDNTGRRERHEIQTTPYVVRMPKSMNHVVGETATLDCSAWGTNKSFVFRWYWSKDANHTALGIPEYLNEISNGSGNAVINNVETNRKNHFKSTLTLYNLTYEDYKYYSCFASNQFSSDKFTTGSSYTNLRVKDKLAPLWPFIGICVEIVVLIIIIVIYEKRKTKRTDDDDSSEKTNLQSNANDHKGEENVRFRK